jgi:lipopolysaccharide transport system permease protein
MVERFKTTIYSAESDTFVDYIQKIWQYRALIWVFAKRDLKVKYAQTWLGLGWTIFQPLTAFAIYTFFFGFILKWKTDGIDYPVYVLSGLLGWNFFAYIVSSGTYGIQESAHLIKKIYFPKTIIPLSKVLFASIELGINLMLLVALILVYQQDISWKIIFLPLIIVYNAICAMTLVFLFSALTYKKRDILHFVPFILQFGIWFSPVFFSRDILPNQISYLMDLNPLANVVELWRYCLFGFGELNWVWLIVFFVLIALFGLGFFLFSRVEYTITDNS